MRTLDWLVLAAFLIFTLVYGYWKGRGTKNIRSYMLADKSMPWYAVGLSVMATQASAITFVSTPGQAYADGMRFVQVYFGLPIAMVILAAVAIPIFHRLEVYTAYEFLEHRFDLKTRTLASCIFLVQRGVSASISLYAPALILSVVLGWDQRITVWVMGAIILTYTVFGGVKSVNWNDFQQFIVIMGGMGAALIATITLLPSDVSFGDAVSVAGTLGRLNAVDFSFDPSSRYNFWSGIIGGLFLALAYFGTDQSQVQRYLTGRSVTHSRLGLLFNGMAKVPMQFFILFVGAMVFAFYQFTTPPLFFNQQEEKKLLESERGTQYRSLQAEYQSAEREKQQHLRAWLEADRAGNSDLAKAGKESVFKAYDEARKIRAQAVGLIKENDPRANTNDNNYVFLSFVTRYLPAGLVGLIIIVVFGATMASTSSELNALATCTMVDIYKRLFGQKAGERRELLLSRLATAGWCLFAVLVSQQAGRLGTLVEAVNLYGSLFYGTVLGIFILAFAFKRVRSTAAFIGALGGQILLLSLYFFTAIPWLWYNVLGPMAVVGLALILSIRLNKDHNT